MKILLVDDHDLFREGLKFLLPALDGSVEFIEASSFEEARALAGKNSIDLILLDYYMPGVIGMEAIEHFNNSFESAMVVVVSGEEDPKVIRAALDSGASGYIPKSSSSEDLENALNIVLSGGTYLPESALNNAATEYARPSTARLTAPDKINSQLSKRQYEVLMKAVQGKANKVIAKELEISDQTVKTHLSHAFKTLGVSNRTEAVYVAAKMGMQPGNFPIDNQ